MHDSRLRAAAEDLGTAAFNSIDEAEVARVHALVFPVPVPGAGKTAELTLCRLAMACGAMAAAVGMSPSALWAFLRLTQLGPILERDLVTAEDRAAWDAMEGRLLAVAFAGD